VEYPPPPGSLPPPPPPPGNLPPPPPYFGVPAATNATDALAQLAAYGQSGQIRLASFWIRLVAAFIDGIIVSIALIVFFLVLGLVVGVAALATGSAPDTSDNPTIEALVDFIYFALYAGYFIYFWGMGQTPAMRIFGIFVADATTGGPIGFSRAAIRFAGYVLSQLACYVGLIWAAFDARKQGWHDKFANSIVVQS
jgi:uncharacterized RDD family membrane protein YckC